MKTSLSNKRGEIIIKKVMIDTSFWKGMIDQKDQYHLDGNKLLHWIMDQNEYEIWVTNLILAEVGNWIKKKKNKNSMKYLNFILNLENLFIFYDRIEFQKSILTLFEQFDDKLGYVDSFNAIVCKKNEIDYLISHDKDYDSIDGIVRIQAPPINF